jgi:peroxiredoxin
MIMNGIAGQELSRNKAAGAWLVGVVNLTLLSSLLFASVVLNVFLARKVSVLTASIEKVKAEGRLKPGTIVPVIQGRSVDGAQQTLDYSDVHVPTVLYVFTPQCGWCAKNADNLRALIANSGSRYRIVGISLTRQDLKQYLEEKGFSLPVYTDIADSTKAIYRLGGTPTTIIVSPEARVMKVWSGVYVDNIRREIEESLKVHLPGCCKETVADQKDLHSKLTE